MSIWLRSCKAASCRLDTLRQAILSALSDQGGAGRNDRSRNCKKCSNPVPAANVRQCETVSKLCSATKKYEYINGLTAALRAAFCVANSRPTKQSKLRGTLVRRLADGASTASKRCDLGLIRPKVWHLRSFVNRGHQMNDLDATSPLWVSELKRTVTLAPAGCDHLSQSLRHSTRSIQFCFATRCPGCNLQNHDPCSPIGMTNGIPERVNPNCIY